MSRPAKAVKTLSGHITKDELAYREKIEQTLRGDADKLDPPEWLNDGQRAVFNFVIEEMAAVDILGNLDVYVLTQFAVATERINAIEQRMNERFEFASDMEMKDIVFARNSYVKDFWRAINELSLSPQARSKIGMITRSKKQEEADPLRRLLAGKK